MLVLKSNRRAPEICLLLQKVIVLRYLLTVCGIVPLFDRILYGKGWWAMGQTAGSARQTTNSVAHNIWNKSMLQTHIRVSVGFISQTWCNSSDSLRCRSER